MDKEDKGRKVNATTNFKRAENTVAVSRRMQNIIRVGKKVLNGRGAKFLQGNP